MSPPDFATGLQLKAARGIYATAPSEPRARAKRPRLAPDTSQGAFANPDIS